MEPLHFATVPASIDGMWSSRLFLKLFLAYAALVILAVGTCSVIVAGWQEEQLVSQVRRRLRDTTILLRDDVRRQLQAGTPEALQKHLQNLGQQAETRFTLVDAEGKVLADSEQSSLAGVAEMDNHLSRQEFVHAQNQGGGYSRRLSPTLNIPFLYYALIIQQDNKTIGFVRAAEPIATILAEVSTLRKLIGLVGLGVGLAGLVVTYWLTRRIVQPIKDLTEAAEKIIDGNTTLRIGVTSDDEVGALARAFERMVGRLSRREKSLRDSADRQSTVLSGMNEGVLAVDSKQRVLFANLAAGNILGFNPDEIKDRTLLETVRSNDLREIVQKVFRDNKFTESEIEWQADLPRTLDVNATPLPGEPCPGIVLVLHDISELKRLENLRQQFVANVSHELKTPLSSIKAYTETLLSGALDDAENARRFLNRIDDQSDRLLELILDMLALARIESGKAILDITAVPLQRVAETCIAEYEARAKSAQITLQNETTDTNLQVQADEESLLQILNNLVDNAIKYTPAGGTVTLRSKQLNAGSSEESPGEALIEVIDTGNGIDPTHHDRLFERFYRVDKARSRELGGTGLGLAIVKHLCQTMNGSVTVTSSLGQGSTFSVQLPLSK